MDCFPRSLQGSPTSRLQGRRKPAFCVSHVAGRSPHHAVLRKQDVQDADSRCAVSRRTGYRRHSACLPMQTRFRSPHLPPGKRQMPLFSGRSCTKNLQPSLYVFTQQYGEETCQPQGTHKKPVFSVPIGSISSLPLTVICFTKSGSKGRFFKSCIQVRLIPHGIHSENRCTFSAFFSVNSRYRRRCHTSEMPQDHGRNIHQMA